MSQDTVNLWAITVEGGNPILLSKGNNDVDAMRYSPDGREIALFEDNEDKEMIVVRNAETGQSTRSFDVPKEFSLPFNSTAWALRWTPDGQTITYPLWRGPGAPINIWSQTLSGGPPRQITHFADEVVAYDWSPDGKQLALTRSVTARDVVLITNSH